MHPLADQPVDQPQQKNNQGLIILMGLLSLALFFGFIDSRLFILFAGIIPFWFLITFFRLLDRVKKIEMENAILNKKIHALIREIKLLRDK